MGGLLLADGFARAMIAPAYTLHGPTMKAERASRVTPPPLDLLYLRYLAPLRRWARGRLPQWARDMRDTDDLVQDTLLHTLRDEHGLIGDSCRAEFKTKFRFAGFFEATEDARRMLERRGRPATVCRP